MMDKVKCYIKEQSILARIAARLMGTDQIAMVIGKNIHLYGISRKDFLYHVNWVRHEVCHVVQYNELGFIPFIWHYLWECIKVGYHRNRFEVAARAAERDQTILSRVSIIQ